MTNGEKIRQMTDEELAVFMKRNNEPWCNWPACKSGICKECCFEWLKEEAKDENPGGN